MDVSEFLASASDFQTFRAAAAHFKCHILIRKTGRSSLQWFGRSGYTGKRADMKAKTADRNAGTYMTAGLVCSPDVLPSAFSSQRLGKARELWRKSLHLIYIPASGTRFGDQDSISGVHMPYILQNDPKHRHYGCIALIEHGLLTPRYVHGDYDLYAIIPAGSPYHLGALPTISRPLISTMDQPTFRKQALVQPTTNLESGLSFEVANFINTRIAGYRHDVAGALMVNHGEQVNLGEDGWTYEPVLAVLAPGSGHRSDLAVTLSSKEDHMRFYQNA